jgi:hypothetical protein
MEQHMSIVGCYTLDLYCRNNWLKSHDVPLEERNAAYLEDQRNHGETRVEQFTGETYGGCKRKAQANGWIFHRDDDVTCPMCAKKKLRSKP